MNYQYFVQVVPTDIQTLSGVYPTYQYSVKEQGREIDHGTNSHGVPSIFFKYDMSALKVIVRQDREPVAHFLVRLCAGVGGLVNKHLFATENVNNIMSSLKILPRMVGVAFKSSCL